MNYKSGDLVKITGNCNYQRFAFGETVRLKENDGSDWLSESLKGRQRWWVRECDMTPVKPAAMPQKIIITTDGKTTLARLFDGKTMVKRAEAKCAPSDVFDFGVGAELAVKRLMGEKPVTEPVKSEPVKLYCVKSFMGILSAGKIYEPDKSGYITYDDGRKSNHPVSDWNFDFVRIGNLVPLVHRPAKVGEWVLIVTVHNPSEHTGYVHNGEIRLVDAVDGRVRGTHSAAQKEQCSSWLWEDEYLVLDGFKGDRNCN